MARTLIVVERGRELYSKAISFICDAKNKINRYLKRIGYEVSQPGLKHITYPFMCYLCNLK